MFQILNLSTKKVNKRKVIRVFEFDEIKQDKIYDGFKFEEKELIAIQKYNSAN